jgi:hypothetical protein
VLKRLWDTKCGNG